MTGRLLFALVTCYWSRTDAWYRQRMGLGCDTVSCKTSNGSFRLRDKRVKRAFVPWEKFCRFSMSRQWRRRRYYDPTKEQWDVVSRDCIDFVLSWTVRVHFFVSLQSLKDLFFIFMLNWRNVQRHSYRFISKATWLESRKFQLREISVNTCCPNWRIYFVREIANVSRHWISIEYIYRFQSRHNNIEAALSRVI